MGVQTSCVREALMRRTGVQRSVRPSTGRPQSTSPRHGLARVLSRMGVCSRSEAERRIVAGRVSVNGRVVRDPDRPADPAKDRIEIDGSVVQMGERICIALNKPRGVVVSAADERGRDTVYALLRGAGLPWLAPVGRLDKASEGLLLLSNDPAWAARITDPATHVAKTYRVQVQGVPDSMTLQRLLDGVAEGGECLSAKAVRVIGGGKKNSWLEIVLHEGRNRQIRRMLAACGHDVLRLLRVAIGGIELGDLPKGAWRRLTVQEVRGLAGAEPEPADGAERGVKRPAARRRSTFPTPPTRRR
ncbi:MAG: rRNA pseudouridine synthase [Proteobacteria bacterium]|nr:rRNA pseudouridine synthase [Pseudomonadota bacterium]